MNKEAFDLQELIVTALLVFFLVFAAIMIDRAFIGMQARLTAARACSDCAASPNPDACRKQCVYP